jgi:hypothetical protein
MIHMCAVDVAESNVNSNLAPSNIEVTAMSSLAICSTFARLLAWVGRRFQER